MRLSVGRATEETERRSVANGIKVIEETMTGENVKLAFESPSVLPDGIGGFTPCPELLTEDEAIRYLRLDIDGPKNPEGTLKYYRDLGVLCAVRIGRNLRYPRKELDLMVQKLVDRNRGSL